VPLLKDNPSQVQYITDMLNYSFNKLNIDLEFRQRPDKRSILEVNMGLADAEFTRIKSITQHYENLIIIPESMITVDLVAFSIDKAIDLNNFTLKENPYHIGYVAGFKMAENALINHRLKSYVSHRDKLFNLLINKRFDIVLYIQKEGINRIEKTLTALNKTDRYYNISTPLQSPKLYFVLNKRHQELVPKLTIYFKEFKSKYPINSYYQNPKYFYPF